MAGSAVQRRAIYDLPMSFLSAAAREEPDGQGADLTNDGLVFDRKISIDYGQFYFESSAYTDDFVFEAAFAGQSNGLCGAAKPGRLVFITGPNVGDPPLRVEERTDEPEIDDRWEDVVETSLTLSRPTTYRIVEFSGESVGRPVSLAAGSYRVRYSAFGMDEARPGATDDADTYLVQLWPAPATRDRVVKETSESAAYWRAHFFES